jgi:hypothetical protein
MPFVQRVVEPKFLSRRSLHAEDGQPIVTDYELEAVTNSTLSSALRQLASLVLIANDIFEDLKKQLRDVSERSERLRNRIKSVEVKVTAFDPRKVTVRKYIFHSIVFLLISCSTNLVVVVVVVSVEEEFFCARKKLAVTLPSNPKKQCRKLVWLAVGGPLGGQIMAG